MEETYRKVRTLSMFVKDFGENLCSMPYIPQPGNPLKPDNFTDLRTAVRAGKLEANGEEVTSGYLFVNNYQRRYEMADHDAVVLKAHDEDGNVLCEFEERDVKNGDYFFYPFNMPIGYEAVLRRANATPLCILHDEKGREYAYVFYTDSSDSASFEIEGELGKIKIVTLLRDEAEHAVKIVDEFGTEHLVICDHNVVCIPPAKPGKARKKPAYEIYAEIPSDGLEHTVSFRVWPDLEETPIGFIHADAENVSDSYMVDSMDFADYRYVDELVNGVKAEISECDGVDAISGAFAEGFVGDADGAKAYEISVTGIDEDMDEVYLHVDYKGDQARLFAISEVSEYEKGELIADSFYTGQKWEIGLKRFIGSDGKGALEEDFKARAVVAPLKEGDKVYLQNWPEMDNGVACRIDGVSSVAQYKIRLF